LIFLFILAHLAPENGFARENLKGTEKTLTESSPQEPCLGNWILENERYDKDEWVKISSPPTGYGEISEKTGRPKTVSVKGYYRKDGTYVKPHYRSKPRR
jgi:hypothetical protein